MTCNECQEIRNKIAFGHVVTKEEFGHLATCGIDPKTKPRQDWDWTPPLSMSRLPEWGESDVEGGD